TMPTTSGMQPRAITTTALRAVRQCRSTKARVSGGIRLPQPHSRLVEKASITSQTRPARISSRPPRISNASIRVPCRYAGPTLRSGFVDLEMGAGRGDGFALAGLPGRDGHVGHPAPLAPDLALGVGVTIMTGAQVIY